MTSESLVIVGASIAGVTLARAARRSGWEGPIALLSDESHEPYDRPPLSKEYLDGDVEPTHPHLFAEGELDELDIDLRLRTPATALDVGGRRVATTRGWMAFDRLVIATGARAVQPPASSPVPTIQAIDDAIRIRQEFDTQREVVILGGGFVALELAAAAAARALEVTVVSRGTRVLTRSCSAEVAARIEQTHREHGVRFRMGSAVVAVEGDSGARRVVLADGARLDSPLVVAGLGSQPAVDWLRGSGLRVTDGVECSDTGAAIGGDGVVYAVGDVARWGRAHGAHWTAAVDQARAVAADLTGHPAIAPGIPFVWSDQYDYRLQLIGDAAAGDCHLIDSTRRPGAFLGIQHAGGEVIGAAAVNWSKPLNMLRRRLGSHPLRLDDAIDTVLTQEPTQKIGALA